MGQVVLMPDSGLLCVGGFDGCAYFGPESRVRRYAPDGTVLWEREIYPLNGVPLTMAAKGPISHVAVASPDSVYIMDLDGNVTGGFPVPISEYVNGMVWASDSTLFMGRGTDLRLVGMDGTQLATAPVSYIEDMYWDGQKLFVIRGDSVCRFTSDLDPLGCTFLPSVDSQTDNRFITSGNGLYVNTANGLFELDTNGVPSLAFPWPTLTNLTTTSCAVRDGTALAVGNTNIIGRNTGIIRTLSMSGDAAQHDQDVEVLVQVNSTWTEFEGGPYPWDWYADITGFVVNHGSDTLHSVVLSMWVGIPIDFMFCGQTADRIDTMGLAVAPGDTVMLPFGAVGVDLGIQTAAGSENICIVALAPDHLADRAPDDNMACASANFALGVEEPVGNSSLSLAPNPAINSCELSGLAALGGPVHLTIMDLTGRVVAEQFNTASTNNMQLDLSGLPSATYILSADGGSGRAMMKLVIARP